MSGDIRNALFLAVCVTVILGALMWWATAPTILQRWSPDSQTTCVIDKYTFSPRCYPVAGS